MALNVGQYLAPLDSQQVLSGYAQGVIEGPGIVIAPDGTISLNPTSGSSLGFLTSTTTPAPVFNWSTAAGAAGAYLVNDGSANVSWSTGYVPILPVNQPFPHTGAAVLPSGATSDRPTLTAGAFRYNTTTGTLEYSDGLSWVAVSDASSTVQSFFGTVTPTASNVGDLWFDSNTAQEKVWTGSVWIPTTPLATISVPGRVQIGANIQVDLNGVISVPAAVGNSGGLSSLGLSTVTDNTSSFATDSALSANQGRLLQLQISSLLVATDLSLAGLVSGSGILTYVTTDGAAQGFVVGNPLPVSSAGNTNYFVIVEAPGSFTPPGGSLTTVTQGDWFLSTGTGWQFLNVGYDSPAATTATPGIVQLSTNAQTQTGTDATLAVTPASLSSRTATETRTGLAEIATQAETDAGTDDTRFVTPLKLTTYLTTAAPATTAANVSLSPAINGNVNAQTALQDAVYDITSTGNTVTITSAPTGLFNIEVAQATETLRGGAEVATQAEVNAGTDDTRFVTPLKLATYVSGGQIIATEIPLSPVINGNTTVQAALNDAIYNVASSGSSVTITETATGQINLAIAQATETQLGGGEIATQAETNTGTSDTVLITPLKLRTAITGGAINSSNVQLSTAINGNTTVQSALADAVYDITSTGNTIVITSSPTGLFNVEVRQATETQLGGAEVATQVEVNAGTDDTRFVTPLKLATYISGGQINATEIPLSPAINGNTTVQAALNDAIYNVASSGSSITITETATGQINLAVTQATETQLGGGEIATQAETNTGTSDTVLVTPLKLRTAITGGAINSSNVQLSAAINGNTNVQSALLDAVYDITSAGNTVVITSSPTGLFNVEVRQATETQLGGAEVATQAETNAGTDDTRIVTPLKLATRVATETLTGIAEIATQAEVNAGTDDTRIVTPLKLATYVSAGQINATEIPLSPAINGNTTVQSALGNAIYNVASPNLTVTEAATGQVTITLPDTTVAPNPYTYASITVDAQGRLTAASSGVAPNTTVVAPITNTGTGVAPVIGITASSTTGAGAVQLNDTTSSTSTTLALTAAQGKNLQDQINVLTVATNLVLAGTFNATTGLMVTVTSDGTAAGFTVGFNLPAPAPSLTDFFVLVTTAGSYSPPGGGGPYTASQGDWFVCNGTTWDYLNVGFDAPAASTAAAGIVKLATNAETQTGTDATLAVTPASLQSKLSNSVATTSSTTIASSTAVKTAYDLAFDAIPKSTLTNKGSIVTATAASTPTALTVGTNGQVLSADSASTNGLTWITPVTPNTTVTAPITNTGTAIAPIIGITAASTVTSGAVQLNNTVTSTSTTQAATANAVKTAYDLANAAIPKTCITNKGALVSGTAANTPTALPVGTNGQVLTADSTSTSGLKWVTPTITAIRNIDDISGSFNGTTTAFPLAIGGVAYAPNPTTNIAVFLGGVAQTPGAGNAYTVAGSTITFTSAPPTNTTFYAFTVC